MICTHKRWPPNLGAPAAPGDKSNKPQYEASAGTSKPASHKSIQHFFPARDQTVRTCFGKKMAPGHMRPNSVAPGPGPRPCSPILNPHIPAQDEPATQTLLLISTPQLGSAYSSGFGEWQEHIRSLPTKANMEAFVQCLETGYKEEIRALGELQSAKKHLPPWSP